MDGNSMPANPMIIVFMGQWLSNKTNMGATSTISNAFPVRGNYARLQYLMITLGAASGTATIKFTPEATVDGGTWIPIGAGVSVTESGPAPDAISTLGYAFLRVRAEVTAGTETKGFFNGVLTYAQAAS